MGVLLSRSSQGSGKWSLEGEGAPYLGTDRIMAQNPKMAIILHIWDDPSSVLPFLKLIRDYWAL